MRRGEKRPPELRFLTEMEPAWCKVCDKRLPDLRHWRTAHCGRECSTITQTRKQSALRAAERAKLTCVMCEGPIVGAIKSDVKVCGPECGSRLRALHRNTKRHKAGMWNAGTLRPCKTCGTAFPAMKRKHVFCGKHCYNVSMRKNPPAFRCDSA